VFEAPVEFGDDRDMLEFRENLLTERFATADPVLHALLRRQAEGMLRAHVAPRSLLERVRIAVREELGEGAAAQPSVARRVGVSVATLRRRLEGKHGVRYSDLVDELRRERIEVQLADPSIPIERISYQAGFSQRSAFYRTFKRWYGCTPVQYRRAHSRPRSSA
jgi:AraC-like DNA-binding protein